MSDSPTTATIAPIETLMPSAPQEPTAPVSPEVKDAPVLPEVKDAPVSMFKGVTKDAEGNLIWKSSTAEGTIYKGKTEDELFQNIAQGVEAKDTFISKLKAEKAVPADTFLQETKQQEIVQDVKFPDRNQVFNETLTAYGVDPQMMNWSDSQWDEWAISNNYREYKIIEARQAISEARKIAETRYNEQNLLALNSETEKHERRNVQNILIQSGLDPSEFNYKDVIEKVKSDPNAKNAYGMFMPGAITATAALEINKIISNKLKNNARTTAEKEIMEAQQKLKLIRPDATPRAEFQKADEKPAVNTRQAMHNVLAGLRAG